MDGERDTPTETELCNKIFIENLSNYCSFV